jgi:NarL family two-component system sensor histidine kinase LiaS
MSTTQRQMMWSVGLSFVIAIAVAAIFFVVFPLSNWSSLWDRNFMGIPFVIFIPAFSITVGIHWRGFRHVLEKAAVFS